MATYRVQSGSDVQTFDEEKLRKKLRESDLSGVELVRRDGDEDWVPLCETALFREEVPFRGDPHDAARGRQVRGFAGHLMAWAIVMGIFGALGTWFPAWLLIWGIFVVVHGAKVAPTALALQREGKLFGAKAPKLVEGAPAPTATAPETSPWTAEVANVRALLTKRGGEHATRLAAQLEGLAASLQEMATRRADLQSQLTPDELGELEQARAETDERLRIATTDQDRELLRRELDAVNQRHEAAEQAQRTIDRLQSRQRVAEHQLKQLRLDLSQAEARDVDVPDLAGRVESIRLEAAAIEEVEEALAENVPPARSSVHRGTNT